MFSDFYKEIQDEIKNLNNLKASLEFLTRTKQQLEAEREIFADAIYLGNSNYNAFQAAKLKAPDILWGEAKKALVKTKEFNIPIFSNRLEQAIKDRRTISMSLNADGALVIKINLDLTAGTIEDYASAITATREALGIGRITRWNPYIASYIWMEKYYKPAREGGKVQPLTSNRNVDTQKYIERYWLTIETRVSFFESLAPFWSIIEHGNIGLSLESDEGGYPYPKYGRTNFTKKAIDKIQKEFEKEKAREKEDLAYYRRVLETINRKLDYIDKLISELSNFYGGAPSAERVELVSHLKASLGSKFPLADPDKIAALLTQLQAGLETRARVELTQTGTGVRVRARTLELQRIIQRFRSR